MEVGVHTLGVMKSIKQALDPYWIMNPGKIMDVPVQRVGLDQQCLQSGGIGFHTSVQLKLSWGFVSDISHSVLTGAWKAHRHSNIWSIQAQALHPWTKYFDTYTSVIEDQIFHMLTFLFNWRASLWAPSHGFSNGGASAKAEPPLHRLVSTDKK